MSFLKMGFCLDFAFPQCILEIFIALYVCQEEFNFFKSIFNLFVFLKWQQQNIYSHRTYLHEY